MYRDGTIEHSPSEPCFTKDKTQFGYTCHFYWSLYKAFYTANHEFLIKILWRSMELPPKCDVIMQLSIYLKVVPKIRNLKGEILQSIGIIYTKRWQPLVPVLFCFWWMHMQNYGLDLGGWEIIKITIPLGQSGNDSGGADQPLILFTQKMVTTFNLTVSLWGWWSIPVWVKRANVNGISIYLQSFWVGNAYW